MTKPAVTPNVNAASTRLADIKRKRERDSKLAVVVPQQKPEPKPAEPVTFWDMFADWFDFEGEQATLTDEGKQKVVEMRRNEDAELDRNFAEAMQGMILEGMRVAAIVPPHKLEAGEITKGQGQVLAKTIRNLVAYAGFLQYTVELMQTETES